jgi:hypothetical protein
MTIIYISILNMNKIDYIVILTNKKTQLFNNYLFFQKINPIFLDTRLTKHLIINSSILDSSNFITLYLILKYFANIKYKNLAILDEQYSMKDIETIKTYMNQYCYSTIFNSSPLCMTFCKIDEHNLFNKIPFNNDWYDYFNKVSKLIMVPKNTNKSILSPWEIVFSS